MGEWKTVKLSEVLRYRKGNILISNDEEYSLCRVQLHRRGVVLREKKMGSQIKTKKQQVCRAGDLVLAEMDAKFGGYGFIPDHLDGAIVSSHYYLYELDKNKITQEYFEILIKTDFIQNQIEAKGSTNYSSIRAWEFLDYEIPLQSIALQNSIAAKYLKHSRFKEDLGIELYAQLKYLSQLRQRILQEAIEGKLTAKWRVQHPDIIGGDNHASKLLEKIKAEKGRLTKEGKFKKDKPLAPISDDEKPFELPDGWVWCRLGDSGVVNPRNYIDNDLEVSFSPMALISEKYGIRPMCETKKWGNVKKGFTHFAENDVAIAKITPCFENSKACVFEGLINGYGAGTTELHVLRPITTNSKYVYIFFKTPSFLADGERRMTGVCGQKRVPVDYFSNALFPLAPLTEQQAIVERVNKLMSMIDALEKQVSERKEQSKMLMQSVLREAFAR